MSDSSPRINAQMDQLRAWWSERFDLPALSYDERLAMQATCMAVDEALRLRADYEESEADRQLRFKVVMLLTALLETIQALPQHPVGETPAQIAGYYPKRNEWECDFCGTTSPATGVRLCVTCERIEVEAGHDLAAEPMYAAAVRLLNRMVTREASA